MTLTVGVGCLWAFGIAYITVGYLNTATGFLVSIIAGNGINFGIIYMARYLEARRDEKLSVAQAIKVCHADTHTATLAAAGAAMIAYGSLAVTDFRGFKHFGIIGGAGMILCWIATYAFLPAFLVLSERYSPMFTQSAPAWRSKMKGFYAYPFAFAAKRLPRGIAIAGLLTGVAACGLAVRYFLQDPMEYDLSNVRNERLEPTSAGLLSVRVDKIVGRLGQDGRAILTDRLDQVQPLVTELERRRDSAPPDKKPFDRVVSIYDLLPQHQDEKLKLLAEMKDRIDRGKKHGFISGRRLEEALPAHPRKALARSASTSCRRWWPAPSRRRTAPAVASSTSSRREGRSVYDAHYLMLWADSFREVKLAERRPHPRHRRPGDLCGHAASTSARMHPRPSCSRCSAPCWWS